MIHSEINHSENNIIQTMIVKTQGLWYYLIAEITYHPSWLSTQYKDVIDPLHLRCRVRELIVFVKDKLQQARVKIDKITDPFRKVLHSFATMMEKMGGDIMETLEPYMLGMEVTMIIDCFLVLPGMGVPRSVFD